MAAGTIALDAVQSAEAVGLQYVTDDQPGMRRQRCGRGFRYLGPDGALLRDRATLIRIRGLTIPPAWTEVWICREPNGHLQATGRDDRGRKQYLYHEDWRTARDEIKYDFAFELARRAVFGLDGFGLSRHLRLVPGLALLLLAGATLLSRTAYHDGFLFFCQRLARGDECRKRARAVPFDERNRDRFQRIRWSAERPFGYGATTLLVHAGYALSFTSVATLAVREIGQRKL
jgi:hypothetical protein